LYQVLHSLNNNCDRIKHIAKYSLLTFRDSVLLIAFSMEEIGFIVRVGAGTPGDRGRGKSFTPTCLSD